MRQTIHGRRHVFEMTRELIDVTRAHRADEHWRFVDPSGHVHQWEWPDGKREYRPDQTATIPTVTRVVTAEGIDEDGVEFEDAHMECLLCGAIVEPGFRPDTHRQYIAGMITYYVDGFAVTPDEYERLAAEDM